VVAELGEHDRLAVFGNGERSNEPFELIPHADDDTSISDASAMKKRARAKGR
jgi:hypothetical protein